MKLKKHLFVLSFIFIFLLAVGCASAADSDNITDDSQVSLADADAVEIESSADEITNCMNDETNDILSDDDKADSRVDVENVTVVEGDNVIIPFNVTDSSGSLISGDVNVSISGDYYSVSKNFEINNGSGQFQMTDLIEVLKVNNKWNVLDIYNIIADSADYTNGNISLVILGLEDVYNALNLNISTFIGGMEDIVNGSDVNISEAMDGWSYIVKGINISEAIDGLSNIFNMSNITISDFVSIMDVIMGGFNFDVPDVLYNVSKGIYFNRALLTEGITELNKEFNISGGDSIEEIWNDLNLDLSLKLMAKMASLYSKNTIYLSEIIDLFNEILDYNKLSYTDFLERLSKLDNGFELNLTDIFYKIRDLQFNMSNIESGFNKTVESFGVDYDVVNPIIENIDVYSFNASKVIDELSEITGINISDYSNVSFIFDGMKKIISSCTFNTSYIYEGLQKIMSSFSFYNPLILEGFDKINSSFSYNASMMLNGLNKIADGMNINISSVVSKIILKYGYFVSFEDILSSGVYNITVEYLSNDKYNSAVNDTSKLTVVEKNNTPMEFNAVVDDYNVVITGSMDSNAEGLVVFEIGNYSYLRPITNGTVKFEKSFSSGYWTVNVIYPGDLQFAENSTSVSFLVKSATQISASKISTTYGTSKNLIVTLKDSDGNLLVGKSVVVTLNGKAYSGKTDAKGQFTVAVPKTLIPNTYYASLAFSGDDSYFATSGSVKVVVSKLTSKLTAKAKAFKVKTKTKKYAIALKDNNAKAIKKVKVTIKVNGKTYKATTTAKGKATFKITKLTKKGKYTALVKFAGNKYYKAVSKKVKITVK